MKKVIMFILTAMVFTCCVFNNSFKKGDLYGKWEITNPGANGVYFTFNDTLFAIDETYEGVEYNYKLEGRTIYYVEDTTNLHIPPSADSMKVIYLSENIMELSWFNPDRKNVEIFKLKKVI